MSDLRSDWAGRHVLLTGVTGFVGKVWLTQLLDRIPQLGQATLVVRPRGRKQSGRRRFERICDTSPCLRPLKASHGADLGRFLGARLNVVDGDVEKPLLGIDRDELSALVGSVDLVIHCAGITDFSPDPIKALRVNVNGARHAAQLARKLGAPLVHVSTCYVAGNVSGVVEETLEPGIAPTGQPFDVQAEVRALLQLCREHEDARDRKEAGKARAAALGWPNLYTYSKGLAEHLIATTKGVDWTIVRPSIVECARTWPFRGWNEGLNTAGPLAWLITTPFRNLPTKPENRFDVIPVDDVARGLTVIGAAAMRGDAGGVFQLASSDANPLTFGRCVELTGLAHRRWVRKGGGTAAEKLWIRHLDPVPVPQDRQGLLAPDVVRPVVKRVQRWLGAFERDKHLPPSVAESEWGGTIADRVAKWQARARSANETLGQVQGMLELFRPFIHDNDYTFRTGRIQALSPAGDPDFGWEVPAIDWKEYWVDVEYPGLQRWSIPAIRGERIAVDEPSTPPLRFEDVRVAVDRAASK